MSAEMLYSDSTWRLLLKLSSLKDNQILHSFIQLYLFSEDVKSNFGEIRESWVLEKNQARDNGIGLQKSFSFLVISEHNLIEERRCQDIIDFLQVSFIDIFAN